MLHIRALDRMEREWVAAREKQQSQLNMMDAEIVKIGNTRRQFEYALKQLGVDDDPLAASKTVAKIAKPLEPIPAPKSSSTSNVFG